MLKRFQDGFAATLVTLFALALVVLDLTNRGFRRWWAARPLTTDVVAGLLVLLITLLVVDQVVRWRQFNDRSRAVAAQAAILLVQATRSSQAISSALGAGGDRDAAADEGRAYMMMLLVAAPVLIEDQLSRAFLEQAQRLGGELARAVAMARTQQTGTVSSARIEDAVKQLRATAAPLLETIDFRQYLVPDADQPS